MSLSSKPPLFSLQLLALGLNRDDAALVGRWQVLQKYIFSNKQGSWHVSNYTA